MQQEVFEVKRERFDLLSPYVYLLQGSWPKEYSVKAALDGTVLVEASLEKNEKTSALERFQDLDFVQGENVTVSLSLPENFTDYKRLTIFAVKASDEKKWFQVSTRELKKKQQNPQIFIEEQIVNSADKTCRIRGWAAAQEAVSIQVVDEWKQKVPCEIQMNNRYDVAEMFKECQIDPKCGFFIEIQETNGRYLSLLFKSKENRSIHIVPLEPRGILRQKSEKYWSKGVRYLHSHGMKALVEKGVSKILGVRNRPIEYSKWIQKHLPDEKELETQRKENFEENPKFSIVVPLYKTPQNYLQQLIESIQNQTYTNWELCLSDGSGADSPIAEYLQRESKKDARIKVVSHEEPLQISENTNAAIEIAQGDFIVFADHDDVLTPNALYECVKKYNENSKIEVFYSDEDKMSMDGNKFFQPHFKPDFNLDLLCTVNYICHLFVVKREVIQKVGMLRSEFDGAQDYDFIFRCVEATNQIYHIPKILYHWRSHEDSTSENPESKMYAFEAGCRAISEHYNRIGVKAEVYKGEYLGLYRTRFLRDYDPLISIIIPNKDHTEDLERCIRSIEEKSTYKNYEYIIVENNSTLPETFEYYKNLEEQNEKAHVVYWKEHFNYSAINNYGIKFAKGEYYLLLNNDTEIINEDCLEELLGYCMREDVGAVGARLYYEDDTIQHAGVVIGFGGIAGHCFVQQPRGYTGYCHRIICAQDYSAVTAACMMVKKSVYDAVGGLSEELEVAFNDIDFCLKIRKYGKLIVYNPYAELYHYESKSRGLEDTPEKLARFHKEIKTLESRWPDIFRDGDPYYNPNLTLDSQDFSLKRI